MEAKRGGSKAEGGAAPACSPADAGDWDVLGWLL